MKYETKRVIIKRLNTTYAEDIFNKWGQDDEVSKYTSWQKHKNINDTLEWLKTVEINEGKKGHNDMAFISKETNEIIGTGGYIKNANGEIEIGYTFEKNVWNKGIGYEVATKIMEILFEKEKPKYICARASKDNIASNKIIKKLGFKLRNEENGINNYIYEIISN